MLSFNDYARLFGSAQTSISKSYRVKLSYQRLANTSNTFVKDYEYSIAPGINALKRLLENNPTFSTLTTNDLF